MVIVDGRTDIEKLKELLATGTECNELDFKETLDLTKKKDELNFVKDAVSMFNRYPGGYIVVGATNEGEPSKLCNDFGWKQFDGARLTDKIRSYIDAPLTAVSALHEIDGHKYCIVCLLSPSNGLPTPFNKLGQYTTKEGKTKVVFKQGDIIWRNGAQNRPIEYLQWTEILAQHDAFVRENESKRINSLIDKITVALGEKGRTPPLVYGMDDEALATALITCFEQEDSVKLIHFVNQLSLEMTFSNVAVDNLNAVAIGAILYGLDDIVWNAIDVLYNYYLTIDHFETGAEEKLLSIAVATYEIGAAMIFANRWDMVSPFVNRQSPNNPNYIYASWIRECQVLTVRAGLFRNDTSTMLISAALDHIKQHSCITSVFGFTVTNNEGNDGRLAQEEELILNLLCSFDFLYCLCVFVVGKGQGEAYPSCVGYEQKRINHIIVKLFGEDSKARRALLPDYSDAEIARGLHELYRLISAEAMHSSRFVWGFDSTGFIEPFLKANSDVDK